MTQETPTGAGVDPFASTEPQHGVAIEQLDAAYASGPDPWRIRDAFYERRKRDVLLGCLPRQRYQAGFEPGCAEGELTAQLAQRCDRLLAVDYHARAVATARERVAGMPGCTVERLLVPAQWPLDQSFDLIVIAELGYYLSAAAWATFCARVSGSLDRGATVLACHWRHGFDGRTLTTDALHDQLDRDLPIGRCVHLVDDDFVLDVWCGEPGTLAAREGLR